MPLVDCDVSAEDLFAEAMRESGPDLTPTDLRLLVSGLAALNEARSATLSLLERKAVTALISYVAATQKVEEAEIGKLVCSAFSVGAPEKLLSRRYNEVIHFLVDLQVDKAMN